MKTNDASIQPTTPAQSEPQVHSSAWLALAERLDGYAAEWRAMSDKNVQANNRDSFQWCDGRAVSYKLAAEEVRKTASANSVITNAGAKTNDGKTLE